VTAESGQTPWIQERDTVAERMLAGGGRAGIADPALLSGKTGLETTCLVVEVRTR
jgi:hypothetical protein